MRSPRSPGVLQQRLHAAFDEARRNSATGRRSSLTSTAMSLFCPPAAASKITLARCCTRAFTRLRLERRVFRNDELPAKLPVRLRLSFRPIPCSSGVTQEASADPTSNSREAYPSPHLSERRLNANDYSKLLLPGNPPIGKKLPPSSPTCDISARERDLRLVEAIVTATLPAAQLPTLRKGNGGHGNPFR